MDPVRPRAASEMAIATLGCSRRGRSQRGNCEIVCQALARPADRHIR